VRVTAVSDRTGLVLAVRRRAMGHFSLIRLVTNILFGTGWMVQSRWVRADLSSYDADVLNKLPLDIFLQAELAAMP